MFTDTRTIGSKPSKRQLAQIDRQIEQLYYRHCSGTTINVLDIGKVFAAGRTAALAGQDIAAAIISTVDALAK